MKQSTGHSEDGINELLDHLEETATDDDSFASILKQLADDTSLPLLPRVIVRDRHVQVLRDDDHQDEAQLLLREALSKEKNEYPRFRAAILLARVINEDQEDPAGAIEVLDAIAPKLAEMTFCTRSVKPSKNFGRDLAKRPIVELLQPSYGRWASTLDWRSHHGLRVATVLLIVDSADCPIA